MDFFFLFSIPFKAITFDKSSVCVRNCKIYNPNNVVYFKYLKNLLTLKSAFKFSVISGIRIWQCFVIVKNYGCFWICISLILLHRQERNLLDAASNGALASLKIVGAIAANLIAFMSMLAFINATLAWFGDRAGVENLTFEVSIFLFL